MSKKIIQKYKDELSIFPNVHSQEEIIEENIKLEISKEKIKVLNQVLEKVQENIQDSQYHINYNVNIDLKNEELEKLDHELEMLITQKILKDTCQKDKIDLFMLPFLSVDFCVGIYYIPAVIIYYLGLPFPLSDIESLIPIIIGSCCGLGYVLKRNKDYKNVFNNINHTLGNNVVKLNESSREKEQNQLYYGMYLESLITKMTKIKLELLTQQEQKENKIISIPAIKREEPTLEKTKKLKKQKF
jgi:hypothetical protein